MGKKKNKNQHQFIPKNNGGQKVEIVEPVVEKKNKINRGFLVLGILFIGIMVMMFMSEKSPEVVIDHSPYVEPNVERPWLGTGKLELVEYSDLQCPYCQKAHVELKSFLNDYGDKVKYQFRHFPLNRIHPYAQELAEGAECANDQGLYYEYIDIIFANQARVNSKNLVKFAVDVGVDESEFRSCLASSAKTAQVGFDFAEGQAKGVSGTPSFYLDGVAVGSWTYENLKVKVEDALK